MKESFELNAMKYALNNLLTYDCRGGAIGMLSTILVCANKYGKVSVRDIFDMNHRKIDSSWDSYVWNAEDLICKAIPYIIKTEDGKYKVLMDFYYMEHPVNDHSDKLHNWPTDIFNEPIVKKEVLNEKPKESKEPKKCHEYSLSCDSSYCIGYKEDGTLCKNDYPSYSIHVNTTNPDAYNEIFAFAESVITEAQEEEED